VTGDQDTKSPPGEIDLTNCDREPIHRLGRTQSFGALIAFSRDWIATHASANTAVFLGAAPRAVLGRHLSEILGEDAVPAIHAAADRLPRGGGVERLFGLKLKEGYALYDLALHRSGNAVILEMEPASASAGNTQLSSIGPMIGRASEAQSIEDLCERAAKQLRTLTGFDRVMVYRFAEDGSGHVLTETHKTGMTPYKGLHYPATDIPQQARALYKRNLLRIICDVRDPGQEIIAARPAAGTLDLSLSTTRAVSPIHIEYLTNMGVTASMSVSIVVDGELWGLFACHHDSPRILPYDVRTAAELFGQLFAFLVSQKRSDLARLEQQAARRLHDKLMVQLAEGSAIEENLRTIAEAIGEVVPHDGAVSYIDGRFEATGETPTEDEFRGLVGFLNTTAEGRVYQTSQIAAVYPQGERFAERAAGMLALPVSRTPRDYILLFRKAIARTAPWAGNPENPAELGPNGLRLTPRKSFDAWQETVRGTSIPWTEGEAGAAESLRVTLLEVILRMTDAAMKERVKAQEHQELLIAELNHRVRNILNLIKSLVSQSEAEARSVADFTQVVGGRIHALARAHDQITKKNWSPASAHEMVRTEIEAYLGRDSSGRIEISGPDVLLQPGAFTTLSLVVHELLTNAAKYGALTDSAGRIDLRFTPLAGGALEIEWRESGGPPIAAPPSRRGFGTTIIERSVPFELKGEAEIRFETTGLYARFVIPAAHVAEVVGEAVMAPAAAPAARLPCGLSGEVMVVEDNMIIALDAEQALGKLGAARVHVASGAGEAMNIARRTALSFALLDVNLGAETSEPVAELLRAQGVPFCFATGYGDSTALSARFPGVPVITKPYDRARIEQALAEASL
jgi:light-regulated signal transduction histidine kinase (bacteriophytochrome)/CheY-like chemotaxis protein